MTLIPSMDLVDHVRNVDSSIRLSRDVKVVLLELREQLKPAEQSLKVVPSHIVVVPLAAVVIRVGRVTEAVANTSWLLDVEHVGLSVPRVRVLFEGAFAIRHDVGSVLLHEAKHGRAARAAIVPHDERIVHGVLLRVDHHVVDLLGRVRVVDVATVQGVVQVIRSVWTAASQLRHQILCWGG